MTEVLLVSCLSLAALAVAAWAGIGAYRAAVENPPQSRRRPTGNPDGAVLAEELGLPIERLQRVERALLQLSDDFTETVDRMERKRRSIQQIEKRLAEREEAQNGGGQLPLEEDDHSARARVLAQVRARRGHLQ